MRFLVDMNLSPAWVPFLRDAGFEAVHWSEVGAANASDRELMDWADAHDHIVLTSDLDFSAILAATRRQRPSVVLVRSDLLTTAAIGGAVTCAIEQTQRDLADGAVVSVDPTRARIRILPLRPER